MLSNVSISLPYYAEATDTPATFYGSDYKHLLNMDSSPKVSAVEACELAIWAEHCCLKGKPITFNADEQVKIAKAVVNSAWIYFLLAPDIGRVKIGFTSNLSKRITHLSVGSPSNLILRGAVRYLPQLEKELHYHFRKDRARGEWFNYTEDIAELAILSVRRRTKCFIDLCFEKGYITESLKNAEI